MLLKFFVNIQIFGEEMAWRDKPANIKANQVLGKLISLAFSEKININKCSNIFNAVHLNVIELN